LTSGISCSIFATFNFTILGNTPPLSSQPNESADNPEYYVNLFVPTSDGYSLTTEFQKLILARYQGRQGTIIQGTDVELMTITNFPDSPFVFTTKTETPSDRSSFSYNRDTDYTSLFFKPNTPDLRRYTPRQWKLPIEDDSKLDIPICEIRIYKTCSYFKLVDGSEYRFYFRPHTQLYKDTVRTMRLFIFTNLAYPTETQLQIIYAISDDTKRPIFLANFMALSPGERVNLLLLIATCDFESRALRELHSFLGGEDFLKLYDATMYFLSTLQQ